ncbi:MAG: DUF2079 domain-containing protein [Thermogemmatispora sp.]|uniref:DUF2079 domain-containing protein n=1 Tax=Thermogemmatispora sp. TaxID=1968838 RepID=UPI002622CCFE|nr:DUF2079 domain-containing protein [Thermogemmatispora sp.]MBX5455887.1 DUF2079 domain-containing protein [Thermogemmatispora sp.]
MKTSSALRKWLAVCWNRLYLYPPPEPLPRRRSFWVAMALVAGATLLFSAFFIWYLTARQDAFQTNAEDLGIMDQAVWSILHSGIPHQTICNIVGDTNCYGSNGISRFAIHFEPILFPVALLYLLWATPKTLLVLQTLVVATGAFPAFWLARLRLRNEWIAVGFALLYLLHPLQNLALLNDFHAVTFTSALLLFVLYFMYTGQTVWTFIFAVLAMACKEEIPVLVALFGLWSLPFQRRWRSGLGLVLLALAWLGLELVITRLSGGPLLASRYAHLGNGPLDIAKNILLHPLTILKQYVFEPQHFFYLRQVLSPTGYLPLLAPWVLVLAVPTLALNLLSSKPDMYSGLYHYNAEIVPVLIFASIEALVVIGWAAQWLLRWSRALWKRTTAAWESWRSRLPTPGALAGLSRLPSSLSWGQLILLTLLMVYLLVSVTRADDAHGTMPFSPGFKWPAVSAHTQLAERFIQMIPPSASVSAQSALVPHISHRQRIYLFPYADQQADYIFLDVTSDMYPLFLNSYSAEVKKVLFSGQYGIVAAQDGYLLLKRGLPAPGISSVSPVQSGPEALPALPSAFCSFQWVTEQQVEHPITATFSKSDSAQPVVDVVGYSTPTPATIDGGTYLQFTFYLQARSTSLPALNLLVLLRDSAGHEHLLSQDFPGFAFCPTTTWRPGQIYMLKTLAFSLGSAHVAPGLAHISIALVPVSRSGSTMMDVQARLPVQLQSASGAVRAIPDARELQLTSVIVR